MALFGMKLFRLEQTSYSDAFYFAALRGELVAERRFPYVVSLVSLFDESTINFEIIRLFQAGAANRSKECQREPF